MLRAYEAVVIKGRIDWVAPRPQLADGTRLLVVAEEAEPLNRVSEADHCALETALGGVASRRMTWTGN